MIKYVEKTVTRTEREAVAYVCDCCKKEFKAGPEADKEDWTSSMELDEFHHIQFTGGYSSVFGDMTEVACDLCQYCLKKMLGDFWRDVTPVYGDEEGA